MRSGAMDRRSFVMAAAGYGATEGSGVGAGAAPQEAPLIMNVLAFGAIGDGSADDAPAIQAAIEAASVSGLNSGVQPIVYLPAGQYLINTPLVVLTKGLTIRGAGNAAGTGFGNTASRTIIRTRFGEAEARQGAITLGSPLPEDTWDLAASYVNTAQGTTIERISFLASPGGAFALDNGWGNYERGAYGIIDWGGGNLHVADCDFQWLECGFLGVASDFNRFSGCTFQQCRLGAWFAQRSDQLVYEGGAHRECDMALRLTGVKAHSYLTLAVDTCGTSEIAPIEITSQPGSRRPSEAITFVTPWLEHQNYGGRPFGDPGTTIPSYFRIDGEDVTCKGVRIINPFCTQGGTPSAFVGTLVRVGNATGVSISGDISDWRGHNPVRIVASTARDAVSSFTVVNGGRGFDIAPRILLVGGGGSGAAGQAVLEGDSIADVVVTSPGSGYSSAPSVFASLPLMFFYGPYSATAQIVATADFLTTNLPVPGDFTGDDGVATPTIRISTIDKSGLNVDVLHHPNPSVPGKSTVRQVDSVHVEPILETYEVQARDIPIRRRMELRASVSDASWLFNLVDEPIGSPNGRSRNWGATGLDMSWNGGHLVVGNTHIWKDDFGSLRSKQTEPTGSRDGSALGHPTAAGVLQNGPRPSVAGLAIAVTGGRREIVALQDGIVGQEISILAAHEVTIASGPSIALSGATDFVMRPGATITLRMFRASTWHEVARSTR